MQNTGNIRFRTLVEKLRPAYVTTSSRKEKAGMISKLVQLIQSRQGRFLQRLCDKEVEQFGVSSNNGKLQTEKEHYVEMTDDEAAEKAKQAIRYVHYKKVPLEEERRKKRAAETFPSRDNNTFFIHSRSSGNDKGGSNNVHTVDCGQVIPATATLPMAATNQMARSQHTPPNANTGTGVSNTQKLQQMDMRRLLTTLQNTPTALASQLHRHINDLLQASGHQPSSQDSGQQATLRSTIIQEVGKLQQKPNAHQKLKSCMFPNTTSVSHDNVSPGFLNATGNQGPSEQQVTQLNLLLQSLIQQQQSSQPNAILETVRQQQQQQQHQKVNSALQILQQQHQLTSTMQCLQQPQQASSDPQFQQHLQQVKAISILASLCSNPTTNPQAMPALSSLITQPPSNTSSRGAIKSQSNVEITNTLLASFLASNMSQISAFQQTAGGLIHSATANSSNVNGTSTGQHQERSQALLGGISLQSIPALVNNVNAFITVNSNNTTKGQMTHTDGNSAKRPRLSLNNDVGHRA